MVFSIIIILLVLLIAYFHYAQGFFSATLSAMITVIAALLAISYHETVVNLLLKGKMSDIAHSLVLSMIFALTYIVLRVIFDAAIPGNVRTPATVDKIGAALMGLISAIFVTGIFAIAAQLLPFGPSLSLLGYGRYATKDTREVVIPSSENGQNLDSKVHDEMVDTTLTGDAEGRGKQKGLLIPVDDWVLDTAYHVSDGGSLAGDRTLSSVHPDYLQELFGERLGQQDGARRSALVASSDSVTLGGVFAAQTLPAVDGQLKDLRQDFTVPRTITSKPTAQILIVRIVVHGNATDDSDGIFRFSTGSVRLVSHGIDYYPIGLLENAQTLLVDKPDDFLFLNVKGASAAFDAVFVVGDDVLVGGKAKTNEVSQDTFVAVKRLALLDLSGQTVGDSVTPDSTVEVLRSKVLLDRLKLPTTPPPPAPQVQHIPARPPESTPAARTTPTLAPVEAPSVTGSASAAVSSLTGVSVGCKTDNIDDPNVTVASGTVALKGGNIAVAQIDPVDLSELAKGDSQLKEFAVPDGYKLVQVTYTTTGSPYAWVSQNGGIHVADANNNTFKANGVIVRLNQGTDKVMVRYNMNNTQFSVPSIPAGTPQGTAFLFVIRSGTHLTSLQIGSDSTPISLDVP